MKIRVHFGQLGFFIALMCIIISFAGFVGNFSIWVSLILPIYSVFAILYMFISWAKYGWFQNVSTNHPKKGESIHFEIRFSNDAFIPLLGGTCTFTMPDSEKIFELPIGFFPNHPKYKSYTVDIHCPYRGTYIAGIRSINLSTPLGIIQTKIDSVPQTFYVYPELCALPNFKERYTITDGSNLFGTRNGQEDYSVFESTAPLNEFNQGGKIAWKKWASTGKPSVIINGFSRTQAVTIVLDLYEYKTSNKNEKLAAEDMVISAAFSLLQHLVQKKIHVNFVCGANQKSILVDSEEVFKDIYERSVNIFFNESILPDNIFTSNDSIFLFTCRPLLSLFSDYEKALSMGNEPHLFVCPPQSEYEQEKQKSNVIIEERQKNSSKSLFYIADVKNGSKEITDAFKS